MLIWQTIEREQKRASRIARRAQLIDTLVAVLLSMGIGLIALRLSLRYFPR